MKKKVYKYVISYIYTRKDNSRGNGVIRLERGFKLNNFKHLREVEVIINNQDGFKDIAIVSISYLGKGVAEFETN